MAKFILCAFLLLNFVGFAGSDFNDIPGNQSASDQFYASPYNFNIFEYSQPIPLSNPPKLRASKTKMVVRFKEEANDGSDFEIKAKYKEIYIDSTLESTFKSLKQEAYNKNVYILVTADFKETKLNKTEEWFIEKSKFHNVFKLSDVALPFAETKQFYAAQILPIRDRNCFTLNCFNKKIAGYKIGKNKYLVEKLSKRWINTLEQLSKLDNRALITISSYANNNEYCKDAPASMIFMENQEVVAPTPFPTVQLPHYFVEAGTDTMFEEIVPPGYSMPNVLNFGSIQDQ